MQCHLCNSKSIIKKDTYTSNGYDILQCLSCDIVFADPMKSPGKEWYEKSELYSFNTPVLKKLEWYEKIFLDDKPNNGKGLLLNIGCGNSNFLKLVEKIGYKVLAIDFNKDSIEFTKKVLGIKEAYNMDVFDFIKSYNGTKFDVIIFFEVLEHLESPVNFIQSLKKILKQNGYIVLSVPNRNRLKPQKDKWDYPPHHLTRWNLKSLNFFLIHNGFKVKKIVNPPLSADDLLDALKVLYFGIPWLEKTLNETTNKRAKKYLSIISNILLLVRVAFYRFLAILIRPFIREGTTLYAIATKNN